MELRGVLLTVFPVVHVHKISTPGENNTERQLEVVPLSQADTEQLVLPLLRGRILGGFELTNPFHLWPVGTGHTMPLTSGKIQKTLPFQLQMGASPVQHSP